MQYAVVAGPGLDPGARAPQREFALQIVEAFDTDVDRRAGRRVPTMLAEMENQLRSRNLRIQRESSPEAMLPIHGETKLPDIEGHGLVDVEDTDDRNGGFELNLGRWGQVASLAQPQ